MRMYPKLKLNNRGVALILTILLMSLILFLVIYILSFSLTEDRIARSQSWGAKTYYLAEAGIQEMVWKLKNDSGYSASFETDPAWTTSFTRNDPFGAGNGSYTVSIQNTALAHGTITASGTIAISGSNDSQRIVKTYVYKALGQSGVADSAGYADGDVNISAGAVNFYNGSARSNLNFIVNLSSAVNIDDDLNAVNQFIKSQNSTVTLGGVIHANNYPPAAAALPMPAVDFDSADPNSLKNQADVVYTSAEFNTLMQNNQNLTLNDPITYVTGDIELKGNQILTLNGLLVSDRDIIMGNKWCWSGFTRCGVSTLTINHTAGAKAGLIAKRKINFEIFTGNVNISGTVYANDQINVLSLPQNFNIVGGLIGRKLTITSVWQPMNITHDNAILVETLGATAFSPVITVEHWEEEY